MRLGLFLFHFGASTLSAHLHRQSWFTIGNVYVQVVRQWDQTCYWSRLPVSLVCLCLRFLPLKDWGRVQATSRQLRHAAWDPFAFCPVFRRDLQNLLYRYGLGPLSLPYPHDDSVSPAKTLGRLQMDRMLRYVSDARVGSAAAANHSLGSWAVKAGLRSEWSECSDGWFLGPAVTHLNIGDPFEEAALDWLQGPERPALDSLTMDRLGAPGDAIRGSLVEVSHSDTLVQRMLDVVRATPLLRLRLEWLHYGSRKRFLTELCPHSRLVQLTLKVWCAIQGFGVQPSTPPERFFLDMQRLPNVRHVSLAMDATIVLDQHWNQVLRLKLCYCRVQELGTYSPENLRELHCGMDHYETNWPCLTSIPIDLIRRAKSLECLYVDGTVFSDFTFIDPLSDPVARSKFGFAYFQPPLLSRHGLALLNHCPRLHSLHVGGRFPIRPENQFPASTTFCLRHADLAISDDPSTLNLLDHPCLVQTVQSLVARFQSWEGASLRLPSLSRWHSLRHLIVMRSSVYHMDRMKQFDRYNGRGAPFHLASILLRHISNISRLLSLDIDALFPLLIFGPSPSHCQAVRRLCRLTHLQHLSVPRFVPLILTFYRFVADLLQDEFGSSQWWPTCTWSASSKPNDFPLLCPQVE